MTDIPQEERAIPGAAEHVYRGPDRRRRPTPRFSRYTFFGGRRRRVRREEGREGAFVDLYGTGTLLALCWVALMNAADSFFTIYHLQVGGIELNPVAAALLNTGRTGFVLGKAALISVALLVLCLHRNFLLARLGLVTSVLTYTALVVYHLWLL
ncbi:MAG: hypothetical protein H6828_10160 [Planctomycetes bacterium]|nr:hypothetical protein [Planctomycetota bacterium]